VKKGIYVVHVVFGVDEPVVKGFKGLGDGAVHSFGHDRRKCISYLLDGFASALCKLIVDREALEEAQLVEGKVWVKKVE
jgi:hypothetical protein